MTLSLGARFHPKLTKSLSYSHLDGLVICGAVGVVHIERCDIHAGCEGGVVQLAHSAAAAEVVVRAYLRPSHAEHTD